MRLKGYILYHGAQVSVVLFAPWHPEYVYLFQTAFLKNLALLSTALITVVTVFTIACFSLLLMMILRLLDLG
jgi:hypothetical protein